MPNEVKKNEDGTIEYRLETGEVYKGDPFKVLDELGSTYVSGKRWTQNVKAENENLKNQQLNPPPPQAPAGPEPTYDQMQLRRYLTQETFGATPEEVSAWRKNLDESAKIARELKEERDTELIAMNFQQEFPEFPGDDKANAALVSILEQKQGPVTYNDVVAAHALAVKRGMYAPLNTDEVNMAANRTAAQQQGRQVPPAPPPANNPDGTQNNVNPWQQSTDELRKQLLEQGGLGKALLDLKPGETFGG